MGATLRIGRLAGIPIGINVLWLVIVALLTWALGADYYPDRVDGISPVAAYLLGLLSALLLFASILLHELGHSIVARRHGVEIEEIDLWLLGGVARMTGAPSSAADELSDVRAPTLLIVGGADRDVLAQPPRGGFAHLPARARNRSRRRPSLRGARGARKRLTARCVLVQAPPGGRVMPLKTRSKGAT